MLQSHGGFTTAKSSAQIRREAASPFVQRRSWTPSAYTGRSEQRKRPPGRDRVDHSIFPLTMSLTSTGNIKSQLTIALGDKGPIYFSSFQLYLKALISRQEFEDQMRDCLDTPHLRAFSLSLSERDSRAHPNTLPYSTIAQLTCNISLRHHFAHQTAATRPTPAAQTCTS